MSAHRWQRVSSGTRRGWWHCWLCGRYTSRLDLTDKLDRKGCPNR